MILQRAQRVLSPELSLGPAPGPPRTSPKIPGSLFTCGSSLVFFGGLLFRGLVARGARTGLGLALKKVTRKGCLERGARRPSRPARPGSTLCPGMERAERAVTRGQGPSTGHSGDTCARTCVGPGVQRRWASVSSSGDPRETGEGAGVLANTGSSFVTMVKTAICVALHRFERLPLMTSCISTVTLGSMLLGETLEPHCQRRTEPWFPPPSEGSEARVLLLTPYFQGTRWICAPLDGSSCQDIARACSARHCQEQGPKCPLMPTRDTGGSRADTWPKSRAGVQPTSILFQNPSSYSHKVLTPGLWVKKERKAVGRDTWWPLARKRDAHENRVCFKMLQDEDALRNTLMIPGNVNSNITNFLYLFLFPNDP